MSNLTDATQSLTNFEEGLKNWLSDEAKRMPLADLAKMYVAITQEYEAHDTVRKRIGALLESMSRQTIPEMMSEQDTKTITIESIGRRITVSQRYSCSILDKPTAYDWLRGNQAGDLITETVNSSSLGAFARQYTQDKGLDLPPLSFKTSIMNYTSVTKV